MVPVGAAACGRNPMGSWKKGIVRRLSGAGPSASNLFLARSVCSRRCNQSDDTERDSEKMLTTAALGMPRSNPSKRVHALHSSLLDIYPHLRHVSLIEWVRQMAMTR